MTTLEPIQKPLGNWEACNAKYAQIGAGENAMIFTEGRPKTGSQHNHAAYFSALWFMVRDNAANMKFLELGSGRGTTSQHLAANGCDVTLLDLSTVALDLARKNWAKTGMGEPKIVEADAANTGLPDESFDCVYNVGLLEHFESPQPVLREALRILKPGGLIFMVRVGGHHVMDGEIRMNSEPAKYMQWMAELGEQALCVPFKWPGVLLLSCWKAGGADAND